MSKASYSSLPEAKRPYSPFFGELFPLGFTRNVPVRHREPFPVEIWEPSEPYSWWQIEA